MTLLLLLQILAQVVGDVSDLLLTFAQALHFLVDVVGLLAFFGRASGGGRRGLFALVLAGVVLRPLVHADLEGADHLEFLEKLDQLLVLLAAAALAGWWRLLVLIVLPRL